MKSFKEMLEQSPQKKAIDTIRNQQIDQLELGTKPMFDAYKCDLDPKASLQRIQVTRGPRNERDEYVDYFFANLKGPYKAHTKRELTKKRVAIAICHLRTMQDLHYLKHICEDGEARGKAYSQIFWGSLKPRPEGDINRGGIPSKNGATI